MSRSAARAISAGIVLAVLTAIAALAILVLVDPAIRAVQRRLPAERWLAVDSIAATSQRLEPGAEFVYRIRARRYETYYQRRVVAILCREIRDGVPAGLWRAVGEPLVSPLVGDYELVRPALIGYAEDEAAPASLEGAERLPGLETWPYALPTTPHLCRPVASYRIRTTAGAEHTLSARGEAVTVGAAPELSPAAPAHSSEPPAALVEEALAEPAEGESADGR